MSISRVNTLVIDIPLSEMSTTEILESFDKAIVDTLKQRLLDTTEFAMMTDECTSIHGHKIVSICVYG